MIFVYYLTYATVYSYYIIWSPNLCTLFVLIYVSKNYHNSRSNVLDENFRAVI